MTSVSPRASIPRLDPYLPAAVGLALGGAGVGTVVDLAPRNRRKVKADRGAGRRASSSRSLGVAAGLIVLLGVPDVPREAAHRRQEDERAVDRATQRRSCSRRSTRRPTSRPPRSEVDALDAKVDIAARRTTSLGATCCRRSRRRCPANVWLTLVPGPGDRARCRSSPPPAPRPMARRPVRTAADRPPDAAGRTGRPRPGCRASDVLRGRQAPTTTCRRG